MNRYMPEGNYIIQPENREYISSLGGLERASQQDRIVEGMAVMCDGNMDLTVDLCGIKGIMPREEITYSPNGADVKDIAIITRVGKPVCFKVIGISRDAQGKPVALLSRRAAQIECMNAFLMQLIPGDIINARVTHLEQFGAFVDIGCGVISLLTVDCISVSRISHPKDRFSVGMQIRTVIKSIDRDTGRIYVTHKELLGTWRENAELFSVGQTVAGIIRSIEDYGVFVELAPNLAGLAECRDGATVGQYAAVFIKNIIPERMKIKLAVIDTLESDAQVATCPKYFIDRSTHIDRWEYSPTECQKKIFTQFETEN